MDVPRKVAPPQARASHRTAPRRIAPTLAVFGALLALATAFRVTLAHADPPAPAQTGSPAQTGKPALPPDGYDDGPFLPGGKWRVHQRDRPQPPVVEPAPYTGLMVPPPADAVVLFDGKDTSGWTNPWRVVDGAMVAGSGTTQSKYEFGDCQLHVEFCEPTPARGRGQGRGNSGVFLMGRYEIQVLDCYQSLTYPDGMTGSLYGMMPPLVNACRKPGEWQTYDIFFTAPVFAADGKVVQPATATVILNGVLVQNKSEFIGLSTHKVLAVYSPHGPKGPLTFQDHGNPVRFRNVWVRDVKR